MKIETKMEQKKTDNLPDAGWSNFKYGLFMAVIIATPPLIPGASAKVLIMGYMGLINIVYIACASVAMYKMFSPQTYRRGGQNRRFN